MDIFLSTILIPFQIGIIIVLSFLPTYGFVCKLKLDPLTQLFIAISSSFTLLYLLEFLSYAFKLSHWIPLLIISGFCVFSLKRFYILKTKKQNFISWQGVAAWAGLAIWLMGFQIQVNVYGTIFWSGDWFEHYERTLLFLDQKPPTTLFLDGWWTLPARGPLFNSVSAIFYPYLVKIFGFINPFPQF